MPPKASANGAKITGIFEIWTQVKGQKDVKNLTGMLSSLRDRFMNLGSTLIWLDRLALALNRTWAAIGETLGATRVSENARDFHNFAQMLGLGVEEFQAFAIVAGQFDAKIRDVVDAFMQMEERSQAFLKGDKTIVATMKGSGLTALDLKGKDVLETFKVLSTAINKLPDSQRLTALQSFFGEEGSRQLGPLTSAGVDRIVALMQEAKDLGAVMSEDQIAAAREYNVQMNRVQMVFTAVGNNVARIFMPALQKVGAWLVKVGSRFAKFYNTEAPYLADQLVAMVDYVLAKLDEAIAWIDQNVMPLEDFVTRLIQGVTVLGLGLAALFNAKFLASVAAGTKAMIEFGIVVEDALGGAKGEETAGEVLEKDSPAWIAFAWLLGQISEAGAMVAQSLGILVSTIMESATGMALALATLGLLVIVLEIIAKLVDVVTALFLVLEAAVLATAGAVLMLVGGFAALAGADGGMSLVEKGDNLLAGSGEALSNAVKSIGRNPWTKAPKHGGYVQDSAMKELLGPSGYATMYGPEKSSLGPTVINQTNNITIPTTATADASAQELNRILKAYQNNAHEAAGPGK